eukprot:1160670-Pelagomonas_calceolata.AAC.6
MVHGRFFYMTSTHHACMGDCAAGRAVLSPGRGGGGAWPLSCIWCAAPSAGRGGGAWPQGHNTYRHLTAAAWLLWQEGRGFGMRLDRDRHRAPSHTHAPEHAISCRALNRLDALSYPR